MELHPLRVAEVAPVTDDSVAITFDVPDELRDAYDFAHGQHLVLVREAGGEELRRTYSICAPAGSGTLRVAVKRLEGGAFSSWAHSDLRAGDVLDVMTPGGRFTTALDPAHRRRYAAIAAGSGITPILSIAATILEREPDSEVALAYGNRTSGSIMFLEELEDLKDRHPQRFQLFHVLSREPQPAELLSGRLDRERLARFFDTLLLPDEVDEWFLCGPLELIEGARALLRERGVPGERIHREVFHADRPAPAARAAAARAAAAGDGRAQTEGAATVTAVLGGRASTLSVPRAGETILDALLAVRSDAPYACKGGVCGTCRCRVVAGETRMDLSYALEEAEIDSGFVLACQAHPVSDTVTVDFDQ
ncbi:1,2-phenylacetyl-CoA epoxidase subunit PaaE [Conexibacter woesei]|uniref:Phenylacetate-CoA oxygenase/reductase, PaaK subunit n=1 Tax=Conexibacter woesei (strain DSM 14684 / CCUG 47730 / CIP 108061 / JCM 11494 / NBRC 100937 / ID131577) TaxID=469383 RepID=D3F5G0_CONWI|nr:1,2-phenylacetyl-CoA epoxidase subunit PaaE [Conexibacter woesei]ADB50627.1 phenylacetate-CoA oxygenase/reductase, PaaK subunit [Conexibacter woesei DSM 14684]